MGVFFRLRLALMLLRRFGSILRLIIFREKMGMKSNIKKVLPFAAMVAVQGIFTASKVAGKAAMSSGISNYVFVVYSGAVGIPLIFCAYLFLRRQSTNSLPPITLPLLGKFFILAFFGATLMQNFMCVGLNYSSPTLAAAIGNLDPATTFLLAVIFRFEKVNIRLLRSHIKIIGTLVSVSGALIMTLYKGPALWSSLPSHVFKPSPSNWVIGGFFFVAASLSTVSSNILLASILKGYPSVITLVLFNSLFGTIQSSVISLIAESDLNAWKLKLDFGLAAIVFSGVTGPAAFSLIVWCIGKKGPVFVSMFGPLGVVIAALMSAIFLGDVLHVGSVVGAIIIVVGFYAVIWAQSKEEESHELCLDHLPSPPSKKIPLLSEHN